MAILPMPEMIQAIRKLKNGDQQAFEELYRWSLPYVTKCVLNVINRICPGANDDLLQDVLQDTYLTIAQKIHTLQNEEAFFQWAGQIATNHALRTGKKETYGQSVYQEGEDLLLELPDERFIPEDILENKEKRDLIRTMIRQLPTPQYLCVVEYFYNGLKEREIAVKLDMPLGTVKTNLSRAKQKMKDIVQTHEKKHGVKLYSMSWLLLLLFVDDIGALFISPKVAEGTLTAVSAQLYCGGAVTAGAAGASGYGAGAAVTAGSVGTTAAVGTGAGAATGGVAAGLGAKIVAGILAVAVAASGTAVAVGFSKRASRNREPVSVTMEMTEVQETILQDFTEDITESVEITETEAQTVENHDIFLTPEELEYFNMMAKNFSLVVVPDGYMPYSYVQEEEIFATHEFPEFVSRCAGENGYLKGQVSDEGLVVSKADVETFLMNTVGKSAEFSAYSPYATDDGQGNYIFKNYRGDEILINALRNIKANDPNTITVTAEYTNSSNICNIRTCTFERAPQSPYGWILIAMSQSGENILNPYYNTIDDQTYEDGMIIPESGNWAITEWIVEGYVGLPHASEFRDIFLTAEELEYINMIVANFSLATLPDGYMPYDERNQTEHYSTYEFPEFVSRCVGENGYLKGQVTDEGLAVPKADVEAFLLKTLNISTEFAYNSPYVIVDGQDNYIFTHYYGDEKPDIAIHNIRADYTEQITVIAYHKDGSRIFTFRRTYSPKGWKLDHVTHSSEKISPNDVMDREIYSSGVVLPESGDWALTY